MDAELARILEIIKASGTLCLNIDKPPRQCRELFEKAVQLSEWNDMYNKSITVVEIPMEGYSHEEEKLLSNLENLPNVTFCSLCGGRRAKNGTRLRGGLVHLPESLQLSTSITVLDFSFNQLTSVPKSLSYLVNLKVLMLDHNDIEDLSLTSWSLSGCSIEELYARNNKITYVDQSICSMSKLEVLHLSSNKLVKLPDFFHTFKCLVHLDVANNSIESLPPALFQSFSLKRLVAGHNKIKQLPRDCISSKLQIIDVRFNNIVTVDENVREDPRVLLTGNISLDDSTESVLGDFDVATVQLNSNVAELDVDSLIGAEYVLPSGVKILIPNNFACLVDKIYCNVISKEATDFKLHPTDQLLSVVLDLTPNGLSLPKPLRVSLPYQYTSCDRQLREIVVRVTSLSNDGKITYEDLTSESVSDENADDTFKEITALVSHFSMFGVVSRLVENAISLNRHDPATLFSTVDSFTRLHFPQNSVLSSTNVTINLLVVSQEDVESIVQSSCCPVSNILNVTVKPRATLFEQPITVHLALPRSLIGRPYDRTRLRLIKCPKGSDDWHDITGEVDLVFSTVDVSFRVHSFSKFWLVWKNVMGVARKVYQRVITYKVQFLATQRKTLPSIVLAQCVRSDLIDQRVRQLAEFGYSTEEACSEVQELMEGDKFKIKVLGDIQIKSGNEELKKHLEENILVKRFHSQYPPEKSGFCKFSIESVSPATDTATGYVSFYRLDEMLLSSPESDRRHHANRSNPVGTRATVDRFATKLRHLDDVLIRLEKTDIEIEVPDNVEHPLQFGDYGSGMFKESTLRFIASQIGAEWEEVGHYLGIRTEYMQRIKLDYPSQTKQQIFFMLQKWSRLHKHEEGCVAQFTEALKMADRTDLAENVLKIYEDGVKKFKCTIKRAKGLPQPSDF